MKVKISVMILAGIALASFNSCEVFVGGHGRGPARHQERHEGGDRNFVQPLNNGLENSFAEPLILEQSPQLPAERFASLNF